MFSVENEQPDGSWVTDCEKPTLAAAIEHAIQSSVGRKSRIGDGGGMTLRIYADGACVFEFKESVDDDGCDGHP